MEVVGKLSADGTQYWDGQRWLPAISADGRWRWSGTRWEPVATRTDAQQPSAAEKGSDLERRIARFFAENGYKLNDDLALVLTTDFFTPIVDRPYDFGAVAAANALSDVYAMGGKPLTALNLVGYPDDKDPEFVWLGNILKGGAERCQAAGCVIVAAVPAAAVPGELR